MTEKQPTQTAIRNWANSGQVRDRRRAALSSRCPGDLLEKLATDKDEWVRWCVAKNTKCSTDLLDRLATDKDFVVRRGVAENPKCPTNLLNRLANDTSSSVRSNVAKHSAAPVSALAILARDRDSSIRSTTASNRKCPSELLEELSTDKTLEVRCSVGENKDCPRTALERLLKDRSWPVVFTAISNRQCPRNLRKNAIQRIEEKSSIGVRKGAANEWGNKFLRSPNLVKALAVDESPIVRKALASNPKCPSSIYKQLLNDSDDAVRKAAALNTNHPVNDGLIRNNPAASPWLQAQLAKAEAEFPGITDAVREGNMLFPAPKTGKALRSTSLLGRIIALSQPATPPAELARASGYRDWRQRMAIARNPATPPKILEKLCEDSNRFVSAQASATLQRDEKKSKELASRIKAQKASKATDVDYKLLSQWIGERLRKEAESEWFHIGPAKLVSRPVEAWAAYVPLSEWWNPNSLSAGQIQKAWDQLYGSRATKLVELLQRPPASKDKRLMEALAESLSCPRELLLKLSTNRSSVVRRAVAANPKCPTSVLESFVSSRDRNLRMAVAGNRQCPPELFDTLASDDYWGVLHTLLDSHKIPETIWNKLASHKDWTIRDTVADSSKCPPSAFKRLSVDKTASIRAAVAYNTQCPADILKVLANDGSSEVR